MVVRWLGAFLRHGQTLEQAFAYEMSATHEVAAESLWHGQSMIAHALVGLRVPGHAVTRKFKGDVWSVRRPNGRLEPTRKPVQTHTECFCTGGTYDAIVIKVPLARLRPHVREAVEQASQQYGLPIITLKKVGDI